MKEKINDAGSMYTVENNGITQYNIFTKAGNYRGGKIYHTDKYALILSGSCELITPLPLKKGVPEGGGIKKDSKQILTPLSGVITIPSGTPNIFYFPEDCHMLEWFEAGCKIEKFERYVAIK